MRKLNTRFFVFLAVSLAAISGAVFGLHRLQAGNIAEALLWQANQAEKDGKLERAAKYLGRYLEFARDDLDEREHLAILLADPRTATTPHRRARARFVIEQVLAKDPQRHALRERLVNLLIDGRSFESAKEHLSYLEKNRPHSAQAAYLAGLWHEAQHQPLPAQDAYRRAIELDDAKLDAQLRLVYLLKQADFGKAPRHAEEIDLLIARAMTKAPKHPGVLSLAAQHAQERGDAKVGLDYLESGLKENPAEPRLYLALGHLLARAGKRGEAIEKLKLGLDKVRKDQQDDLRWSLANLLLDEDRLDEAKAASVEIRGVNAISADYLEARLDMARGRWFEAAQQMEKIRPALKNIHELALQIDLYLGACYEQLEEPALQLNAFQRAAQADAASLSARRGMANACWALGQTGEALRIYQDLVANTRDPREAGKRRVEYVRLVLQGGPKRHAKEWRAIKEELDAIDQALGKPLDALLLRAEYLFAQGNRAKAEILLHDAIKNHPDRHEPWLVLLAIAANQGDAAPARRLMDNAEARFRDQADFRLAQIRLLAGQEGAAATLKKLEDNVADFTPSEQSALLQALAEAHFDAQRFADSARALTRLLQLPAHAQDLRGHMQLLEVALARHDDGQARQAIAALKRIEGDAGVEASLGEALRIIRLHGARDKDALAKARHLLTVAAAQRPNWHPIVQARAELDELQGRPDQAIANYRRAVDLGARDPRATKQLLILLSQAQRFDEVEQVLARIHRQHGASEDLVRIYVAHSYNRRDFRKAEFLIKKIVADDSTNYRDHLWMGQILAATGKSAPDAEKAFRRAVELAPQLPETWVNLVRHLIGAGQPAQAKIEMERLAEAVPANQKHLALAQCSEMLGLLQDATDHYESALTQAAVPVDVHRAAAEFHLRVGQFSVAEVLYRKVRDRQVAASDDDVAAARRGLALALVKQNQPAEALRLAGLALDDKGDIPDAKIADALDERLFQAKVLGSLHHHRLRGKAITILEALHQKNALWGPDQFFLARLLTLQGDDPIAWAKTRNLLKSLIEQYPKNGTYLAFAAKLHVQHREFAEAEPMIARLEALEGERKTAAGGYGSIELRAKIMELRGLDSQATALLTRYAEQPGASPMRKLLLANLQGRLGNYRDAIDLCAEVRQTGSFYHDANAAAVALLRANKPSEALLTKHAEWQEQRRRVEAHLRDAIARNAKEIPARLLLADLAELRGDYAEVESLCRAVLKESPQQIVALNNLAWLLGQKTAHGNEALALIERAIDKHGPRPELLDTRAVIQLNLGDVEAALRDLERVVNEAPTPTRLFHLSRAYEKARNLASAQAMLRQANDRGLTPQQLHPAEHAEYQRVTAALAK